MAVLKNRNPMALKCPQLDRGGKNTGTSAFERQINEKIYILYGVAQGKIAIVEGNG